MIHINLLPVKAAQKKAQLRNQIIILCGAMLLVTVGCFSVYTSVQSDIGDVKQEIDKNNKEISKLQKQIGEVNKFKKLQEELKNKLEVLASLKSAKSGPIHIMDDLIKALPDKLWITDFKEKGDGISISGVGLSEDDVADFMTNLEQSSYYQNVDLKVTKQKLDNGLKLQNFEISCQVETNKSIAKTGKEEK
jgi:type IV pilus assembly protein PilN